MLIIIVPGYQNNTGLWKYLVEEKLTVLGYYAINMTENFVEYSLVLYFFYKFLMNDETVDMIKLFEKTTIEVQKKASIAG